MADRNVRPALRTEAMFELSARPKLGLRCWAVQLLPARDFLPMLLIECDALH